MYGSVAKTIEPPKCSDVTVFLNSVSSWVVFLVIPVKDIIQIMAHGEPER
jgi:hypothetical protein